jgi:FAD/FMN-containing dehydrogenase
VLEASDSAPFEHDYTRRFSGVSLAVVLPTDVASVAGVLTYCNDRAIPVVTQGGNTSLVGGAVPDQAVCLSTSRLDSLEVDGPSVVAGAGVTLAAVQDALGEREVPLDMGSRDSATVGGMVATNAGGAFSFRFGRMGHLVQDLQVVLPSGEVLQGDEALWVAIGLEGTTGVVTQARLRTVQRKAFRHAAIARVRDPHQAFFLGRDIADAASEIDSVEFVSEHLAGMFEALEGRGHFMMFSSRTDDPDPVSLGRALIESGVDDIELAQDETQVQRMWAARDGLNEKLHRAGPPLKLDCRVPPEATGDLIEWLLSDSRGTGNVFGHLLEGNLHVNPIVAGELSSEFETAIISKCVQLGGRVVGEHGAGRAKRHLLELETDLAAIERFHALKARFDPKGIMNPGVVAPIYESV